MEGSEGPEGSDAPEIEEPPEPSFGDRYFTWRGGLVAAVIAAALIAGGFYSRDALRLPEPTDTATPVPPVAASNECTMEEVELIPAAATDATGAVVEVSISMLYPNYFTCTAPYVTLVIEDSSGVTLQGVRGNPVVALDGGTCSTNDTAKCREKALLNWLNWCGPSGYGYQVSARAFGGQLHSTAQIPAPPVCIDPAAPSSLNMVTHVG